MGTSHLGTSHLGAIWEPFGGAIWEPFGGAIWGRAIWGRTFFGTRSHLGTEPFGDVHFLAQQKDRFKGTVRLNCPFILYILEIIPLDTPVIL